MHSWCYGQAGGEGGMLTAEWKKGEKKLNDVEKKGKKKMMVDVKKKKEVSLFQNMFSIVYTTE